MFGARQATRSIAIDAGHDTASQREVLSASWRGLWPTVSRCCTPLVRRLRRLRCDPGQDHRAPLFLARRRDLPQAGETDKVIGHFRTDKVTAQRHDAGGEP
jgi:hypothetical protein